MQQAKMPDQKLDNQLNLALDTSMVEREKSVDLNVGFDTATKLWDVIVKYSGNTKALEEEGVQIVPLLGNYAIVTLSQEKLREFAKKPQVEFIEKPKRLFLPLPGTERRIEKVGLRDESGKDGELYPRGAKKYSGRKWGFFQGRHQSYRKREFIRNRGFRD